MGKLIFAAALAAAGILAPCAVQAQAMTHAEQVTFEQWRNRVQQELGKHLQYPHPVLDQSLATGVVRVKFNCSESGRPDQVTLSKSSGSRALDRAALRAVSQIATLHPLPQSFAHGQAYQAMIMFDSELADGYQGRLDRMLAEAAKTNQRFGNRKVALVEALSPDAAGN